MVDAEYLARAAEMRELAKTERDPFINNELLFLAEEYETLAQDTEPAEEDRPKR